MNRIPSRHCWYPRPLPRAQGGAALYVALVMLILLALIGIVGVQVSTLQERMSANYLAANMAFQRAEMQARQAETDVIAGASDQMENCATGFDPQAWIDAIGEDVTSAIRVRNIAVCAGMCGATSGADMSESSCNWYRITTFSRDRDTAADSSSLAAVDSIFIKP
jgi:type IV pilus assembly protein PilX